MQYTDGYHEIYYKIDPNRLMQQFTIKNGQLHGIEYTYHFNNGTISNICPYFDGQQHGMSIAKYENGKLASKRNYKNGQLHGIYKSFNQNGTLWGLEFYNKGKLDGLSKSYDINGNIIFIRRYRKGKKCGTWKEWHLDQFNQSLGFNFIKSSIQYSNDVKHGLEQMWDVTNNLLYQYHYINGGKYGQFRTIVTQSRYVSGIFDNGTLSQLMINNNEVTDCIICLQTLENPRVTQCGHIYCNECITKWQTTNHVCPMCKVDIILIE